jgi:LPXTG-motif cell wall-anchored protein
MKRLLGIAVAVVMLFTLVIVVPASAEEENVALGKPVLETLNGGIPGDANYWRAEYLTDGVAQDTTNGNALGWIFASPVYAGLDVDASAYIDLGAVYSVDSVVVVPMQWVADTTYPGAYEIYVSTDFANWTKVAEAAPRAASTGANDVYNFGAVEAQYVRFRATRQSGAWADASFYYFGVGEIEVYGTKVKDTNRVIKIYNNYKGDLVTAPPASAEEALGLPTVWTGHTSGSLEWQMTFQTDVSFWGINFPASWGYYATPLRLTIEKTADNSVVLTKDFSRCGDGALTIDLGTTIPAGQYIMKLTIREDTLAAEGQYLFYNVLGHANDMLDDEYCINTNGTEIEEHAAVQLYSFDDGEGFVKLGEEVPPETQPEVESFVKTVARDQLMIDGADRAKFGGNDEVTDVDLKADVGKELKIWGWVGTTSPIKGFGYRVNGQEVSDPSFIVGAEQGVLDAAAAKGATEASRYAIMFPVTEGIYTVEAFVTTDAGTETIWTINVVAGDAQPATGDATVAMFAVIAVLAMGAAVVFAKKRSF